MTELVKLAATEWRSFRIGDVAKTASGTTPSRDRADFWSPPKHPWVKTGEITFAPIRKTDEAISDVALQQCSLSLLPPGSVLVAMYGQGKTRGQSAVLEISATTNQACFAILPNPTFDPYYLQYWLRHQYLQLRQSSESRGGNQANLNGEMLNGLLVPWVERNVQISTARMLKTQLEAVEHAKGGIDLQVNHASSLIKALYREVFRGIVPVGVPPTLEDPPDGWNWSALTGVARLESGHTPSRSRADWWGGDVSWVSLTEIRALDGRWVDETELRTNGAGIANSAARILPRGTVCFSRTASVGLVTIMGKPMATSQDFANWVCGDELDPEFLMYALIRSRAELRALATGATHKTIYMPMLESFQICAPSRPVQEGIVRELKAKLSATEELQAAIEAQSLDIDRLPAKLLAQAFEEV